MPLALGPWEWAADELSYWRRPATATKGLDLRTLAQCAVPGPTPQGRGLFYFPGAVPGGYNTVGDYEDTLGLGARRAIENRLGLAQDSIQATRVADIIFEILTDHRDPGGVNRIRGLMPDHRGRLDLWMNGLLVRSEPFDIASPRWPLIRARLRVERRELAAEVTAGRMTVAQMRKCLGFWISKYRCDYTELFDAGETVIEPLPPETTLSDTFTYSDGQLPTVSSSAWENVEGSWRVLSNVARNDGSGGPFTANFTVARRVSALSGGDHYAQLDSNDLGDTFAFTGPCVRFHSTSNHWYGFRVRRSGTSDILYKFVNPTLSALDSGDTYGSATVTTKLEISGDTLSPYRNGSLSSIGTTSDPGGISSANVRCGMFGHISTLSQGDNWIAEDLAAGGHPAFRRLGRVPAGVQGVRIH